MRPLRSLLLGPLDLFPEVCDPLSLLGALGDEGSVLSLCLLELELGFGVGAGLVLELLLGYCKLLVERVDLGALFGELGVEGGGLGGKLSGLEREGAEFGFEGRDLRSSELELVQDLSLVGGDGVEVGVHSGLGTAEAAEELLFLLKVYNECGIVFVFGQLWNLRDIGVGWRGLWGKRLHILLDLSNHLLVKGSFFGNLGADGGVLGFEGGVQLGVSVDVVKEGIEALVESINVLDW